MKRWQLVALALVVYAVALVATAPATLIDSALRQSSENRLRLADARGSLWSGTGQIEIRDAGHRNGFAKSVAWRLLPAQLLRGKLTYQVRLEQSVKGFRVAISPSRIEAENADLNLPAAALGLAVPKLAPLELTGDVMLHVARLAIAPGAVQGNATLQWHAAGSSFAPVSPLGDYEIRLEGKGSSAQISLRTLSGPLQLDGQGSWTSGSNPAFLGTARIPPQYQQQLAPLLRLIAVERGDGSFALQLR